MQWQQILICTVKLLTYVMIKQFHIAKMHASALFRHKSFRISQLVYSLLKQRKAWLGYFNTGHITFNSSKVIFCVSKAEEVSLKHTKLSCHFFSLKK